MWAPCCDNYVMANSAQGDNPWNPANGKTVAPKAMCAKAWCAGRIRTDVLCHKLWIGEEPTCFECGTPYKAPRPGAPGTYGAKGKGLGKGKGKGKGSGQAMEYDILQDPMVKAMQAEKEILKKILEENKIDIPTPPTPPKDVIDIQKVNDTIKSLQEFGSPIPPHLLNLQKQANAKNEGPKSQKMGEEEIERKLQKAKRDLERRVGLHRQWLDSLKKSMLLGAKLETEIMELEIEKNKCIENQGYTKVVQPENTPPPDMDEDFIKQWTDLQEAQKLEIQKSQEEMSKRFNQGFATLRVSIEKSRNDAKKGNGLQAMDDEESDEQKAKRARAEESTSEEKQQGDAAEAAASAQKVEDDEIQNSAHWLHLEVGMDDANDVEVQALESVAASVDEANPNSTPQEKEKIIQGGKKFHERVKGSKDHDKKGRVKKVI